MIMQPKLFESPAETVTIENLVLYALGDFQSRGKVLEGRELALDRLLGAFNRAGAKYGIERPADETITESLRRLGAKVENVAGFVAKHPYRITVSHDLAKNALEFFTEPQ